MRKKYSKVKAGKWVQPIPRGYLMACCDCGLVHRMDFRVVEGKRKGKVIKRVQLRAWRATKLTNKLREKTK